MEYPISSTHPQAYVRDGLIDYIIFSSFTAAEYYIQGHDAFLRKRGAGAIPAPYTIKII